MDPATFSVNRLVSDVESLRAHLAPEQMNLLADSAGAVLATLHAAERPRRLSKLTVVTPGLGAVGIGGPAEELRAALTCQAGQSWYPTALAAMEKILAGDLSIEAFGASRPFFYGHRDGTAQARASVGVTSRH